MGPEVKVKYSLELMIKHVVPELSKVPPSTLYEQVKVAESENMFFVLRLGQGTGYPMTSFFDPEGIKLDNLT